jgi:CRISPR-associated endoribonuclease Cas6
MRLKITFAHRSGIFLPWDYQYAVQQWIYKVLHTADAELAAHLHDHGYQYEGKSFKLFAFSQWTGFPYQPKQKEGFWINNTCSNLVVSFLLPKQLSTFVSGLFRDQSHTFYLKGGKSIPVVTSQIEILPEPPFKDGPSRYKLITGARISVAEEGQEYAQYKGPDHEDYEHLFVQNLVNKHRSSLLYKGEADKGYTIGMQVFDPIKTQMVIVPKNGNVTKMRGYKFCFELNAPAEIHRTLYNAGAGEECSMGMGWVEAMGNWK